MRGVGHEVAHALLRGAQVGFGGIPLGKGGLYAAQHHVQGAGQSADFGLVVLAGDALVELARGDCVGRALHGTQWPQADAHEPPAQQTGGQQGRRRHGQLDRQQAMQRAGGVAQRRGDDELTTVVQRRDPYTELGATRLC